MKDLTAVGFNCMQDNHPLGDFEQMAENDLRDLAGLSYPSGKKIELTPEEREAVNEMLKEEGEEVRPLDSNFRIPPDHKKGWVDKKPPEHPKHPFKIPDGLSEDKFIERFKDASRKKTEPTDWQTWLNNLPRPGDDEEAGKEIVYQCGICNGIIDKKEIKPKIITGGDIICPHCGENLKDILGQWK